MAALTETGGTFSGMDLGGLQAYAVGMLSEYLSAAWHKELEADFGLDRAGEVPWRTIGGYGVNSECR